MFFLPSRDIWIIDLRRFRPMRRPLSKRKCKHCQTFFVPHPRSAGRQRYCSTPKCHQASKAASQRRWLHKPAKRDSFTGPTQVERVRQWRKANPGSWRRQGSGAPQALQDALTPQETQKQQDADRLTPQALQEACALSWCLVPVPEPPGLSFSAARSLCARLSMTQEVLGQARQPLVTCALVASQSPLYQVLALARDARRPAAARPAPPGDDDPVDRKAVFTQLWEGLA